MALLRNGRGTVSRNHIEEFISEAQVIVKNVGGLPFAPIVGKGVVPFGQRYSHIPTHDNEGLSPRFLYEDQKFMVALQLDDRILQFIDKLEVAAFESDDRRDLRVGRIDGASVRIYKDIGETMSATA